MAAFNAQIQTVWFGDIAFEGTQYTAEAGKPYLDVTMSAQTQTNDGVGPTTYTRWSGIYTIVIYRPFGEGTQESTQWAEKIRLAFPRGLQLPVSPNGANVLNTVINRASNDGLFTITPVSVYWFATEVWS
jgi:hypothetical protein